MTEPRVFRVWEYGETLASGVHEYTCRTVRGAAKAFAEDGGSAVQEVVVMDPEGTQWQVTCDHDGVGIYTRSNGTCTEPVPVAPDPPSAQVLERALRLAVRALLDTYTTGHTTDEHVEIEVAAYIATASASPEGT